MRPALPFLALLALSGCDNAKPVGAFAGTAPPFDPVTFWTGHTHSWGVVENRIGGPTETVATDCIGTPEGTDGVHMVQTLTEGDGTVTHRDWHMKRVSPNHFVATANDMDGQAAGESAGRVFHWRWFWARKPGSALQTVSMDQWMYLMPDGTMMNRTTISKFGFILAEVTEQFSRAP
jgi:hypothetical protein